MARPSEVSRAHSVFDRLEKLGQPITRSPNEHFIIESHGYLRLDLPLDAWERLLDFAEAGIVEKEGIGI